MKNKQVIWQILFGLTAVSSSISSHAQIQGNYFAHKDWEIACDNTGTCRAAGYQSDEAHHAISVLLQRAAGAETQVNARVKVDHEGDGAELTQLQLLIAGQNQGVVKIDPKTAEGQLSHLQTQKLIQALQGTQPIIWTLKNKQWKLSVQGASAILLRMDDFQKRIDTDSALVRKTTASSDQVLKAKTIPKMNIKNYIKGMQNRHAIQSPTTQQLFSQLKKQTKTEDCPQLFDGNFLADDRVIVFPLNRQNVLVEVPCWRGAYNEGHGYWVMDRSLKQIKQTVTFTGSSFSEGQIFSNQRGRGIGDCLSVEEWAWNGKGFIKTYKAQTILCKGFAGGAWDLPTLLYRVQPES